ncbi:MAG: ABC transporter permease subunit [Verrucomicrobia bacterium]|jgi:oligopeptide transport system permease protein|nr:ABC transporter permease subunit [Verrucomicrobiota bacterium]
MIRFILRRILETIPVLWAVATLTFFMLRLAPGGPFADERAVSPEVLKSLEAHYGLDKPLVVQYGDYLLNLVQGDLGPSFKYPGRTVNEIIRAKFPNSMELGFYSMAIALVLGVSLGVIASLKPNSLLDYVPSSISMVGICLPTFVLGPLLVLVFALKLKWFPYPGWDAPAYKVLPSATLGFYYAAYIARLTRGGMREVLTQDYIRTARAKGAAARIVILRHALRGGILPVVSFMGPAFAGLVAGSFVIETIFNIPGLGKDFVTSAFNRDYTMVLGLVVFFATLIVVFNTLVDVVQVWLNPKLKLE